MSVAPSATIRAELIERLRSSADRRERAEVLREFARRTGLSVAHLRRLAKTSGVAFGYRKRADAGIVRDPARAAAADAVATLILKSGGRMPTWAAIRAARRVGLIPDDIDLPESYVNRWMQEARLSRTEPSGPSATRVCDWGRSGECLQIDSTNCVQWFFVEEGGEIRYARRGEVYRNKPPRHPPIIRYVATDPPSGLFRVQYYQTAGESAEVFLAFLWHVMSRASSPEHLPMAGVPKVLVLDPGPGNLSSAVKNLCAELGIEHRPHLPKHPWAKGSVESTMHVWERVFESELAVWPARDLEDLNRRAYLANCEFCSTRVHGRHGLTRTAYYAREVAEVQLPPAWDVFVEAAASRREARRVGAGHLITVDGYEYYVGGFADLATGGEVEVSRAVLDWNEAERPLRIRHGEQVIVEKALAKDERGVYRDRRVYEKREDAALAAREEDRALRLAAPVSEEPPAPALADLPAVAPPAARKPLMAVVAGPTYRRTPALLRLAELVGRELTRQEVAALGWEDEVEGRVIEAAAAALRAPGQGAAGRSAASA